MFGIYFSFFFWYDIRVIYSLAIRCDLPGTPPERRKEELL